MGVKYIPNTVSSRLKAQKARYEHEPTARRPGCHQSLDLTQNRFDYVTGDLQRHEDHDNRSERGDHLSLPSVRREWRVVVGRQIGIRGHHRYNGGQCAEPGEQRQDYKRQKLGAQYQLGRADHRSRRGQRSRREIRR